MNIFDNFDFSHEKDHPFFTWKNNYSVNDAIVYSDRLHQWNDKKFNECCKKVFGDIGQMFFNRTPEDIEKFLSIYFNKSIILTAIKEFHNVSNGYPYWGFYYKEA